MTKSLEEYVTRETGRGGRRGETVGETVGETRDGERRETVGETGRDGLGREGGEEREKRGWGREGGKDRGPAMPCWTRLGTRGPCVGVFGHWYRGKKILIPLGETKQDRQSSSLGETHS